MELQPNALQNTKWQHVINVVSQHPGLIQHDLNSQVKKLYFSRLLTENLIAFLLQYIGLMFSTLTPHLVPLWLATGTACAFILLRGASILPGIFLGSFFAYFMAGASFNIALGSATVLTLQTQLLLVICYRYISPSLLFYRPSELVKFVIASAILTALACFILEWMFLTTLKLKLDALQLGLHWWLANLNGMLVLASTLVTLDAYFTQIRDLKQLKKSTLILLYGSWILLLVGMLFSNNILVFGLLACANIFFAIKISQCYGWCGNTVAYSLFAFLLWMSAAFHPEMFKHQFLFLQILLSIHFIIGTLAAIRGISDK